MIYIKGGKNEAFLIFPADGYAARGIFAPPARETERATIHRREREGRSGDGADVSELQYPAGDPPDRGRQKSDTTLSGDTCAHLAGKRIVIHRKRQKQKK